MKKFLVALQYWEGDRESSLGLLELFHETVQEKNPWADLVVLHRFDATPPPADLLKKLEHNFHKVYVVQGKHQASGWPDGCNGLWYNLVSYAGERYAFFGDWKQYKALLSIESDTCPLSDDWLEVLSREWDSNEVCVMGAWDSRNGDCPGIGHINGNGMFDINIDGKSGTPLLPPIGKGWDTYFASLFKRLGWQGTYAIRNLYSHKTLSQSEFLQLRDTGAVFLHGIKDNSVRELYLKHR